MANPDKKTQKSVLLLDLIYIFVLFDGLRISLLLVGGREGAANLKNEAERGCSLGSQLWLRRVYSRVIAHRSKNATGKRVNSLLKPPLLGFLDFLTLLYRVWCVVFFGEAEKFFGTNLEAFLLQVLLVLYPYAWKKELQELLFICFTQLLLSGNLARLGVLYLLKLNTL